MGTIQPKVGEPLTEELQLVQAAKGGDVSAFEDLVKRYDRNVCRIAQYIQAELKDILTRTIQGLPPSFRTVFVLRDVEGLSTEEAAEALDLSIPAVKSRLLRARLQLRERLSRYFQKRNGGDSNQ